LYATADTLVAIHVAPLSQLQNVANQLPAYDLLTLLSPSADTSVLNSLTPRQRLQLSFHDIAEVRPDLIAPSRDMIAAILDFGRHRTPATPLLIHCWAGISRSSAAAYLLACDGNPGREAAIAGELRRRAPFATPNRLMVALADDLLQRHGCMVEAIVRIGRGAEAFEGAPYQLPIDFTS
jgi:predicted protein tyrosine phosphatase